MDATALSLAARALRSHLAASLDLPEGQILIGNPATAAELVSGQGAKQFLNVFFYRVEHSGYPADATSEEPIYVRIDCLITAFGSDAGATADRVTAGENDLKLVGGVLASLHAEPVLTVSDPMTGAAVALQIVAAPLTVETINNLWATQVNTSYRPSLAYELAIAPVPFTAVVARSQLVGEVVLGVDVLGAGPAELSGPGWAPEIRFSRAGGLHQVLSFAVAEEPSDLDVVVAGREGERVSLRWHVWTPGQGFRRAAEEPEVTIESSTLQNASPMTVELPDIGAGAKRQLTLSAVHAWSHPVSGKVVEVTSNLLIASVYAGGAS